MLKSSTASHLPLLTQLASEEGTANLKPKTPLHLRIKHNGPSSKPPPAQEIHFCNHYFSLGDEQRVVNTVVRNVDSILKVLCAEGRAHYQ